MKRLTAALLLTLLATSRAPARPLAAEPENDPPRLVVEVVIDQLLTEYLVRFEEHFEGFFLRVLEEGRWFVDAQQYHAVTVTGAGHASLGTGRHPSANGIVGNSFFDVKTGRNVRSASDPGAQAVDGEGGGSSAHNLLCDGLGDWIRSTYPESKVFGVAGKPRSAIFLGGRQPQAAYWLDWISGSVVTSSYYREHLPAWVKEFNEAQHWNDYPESWEALIGDAEVYAAAGCTGDAQEGEVPIGAPRSLTFPHGLTTGQPQGRPTLLKNSPYGDQIILDFARRALEEEELGKDESPDLLVLGLSATDRLGHTSGPHSWELMEQILFLDGALEDFLLEVENSMDPDALLVVLSSDHGVAPLPEVARARGKPGKRIDRRTLSREVTRRIGEVLGGEAVSSMRVTDDGGLYFDRKVLAAHDLDPREVAEALAPRLEELENIGLAVTRWQIEGATEEGDERLLLLRNSYHPERSADLLMFLPAYQIAHGPLGTTHGSAEEYDRLVPIVFLGEGIEPGRIPGRAHTVDVAPTIASLLGVPVPADVHGQVLPLR